MYPQVLLLGIALFLDRKDVGVYSLSLSVPGGLIALFHYREQISASPISPCSTVGYSVSCSSHFVMQFGYITIPMMALTAFIMILTIFAINHLRSAQAD